MKRQSSVVDDVEVEAFSSPSVEVIVARRKSKSTWHIVTLHAQQARRERSSVVTSDERRLDSADSGVKAIQGVTEYARRRSAMAVEPPGEGTSLFRSVCPTHGPIRSNSTVDYSIEAAYWHAINEHDDMVLPEK